MADKALHLSDEMTKRIVEEINGLDFGSVQITVHDGQIVQIERTKKTRFSVTKESAASNRKTKS